MAQISKGDTFVDGQQVTGARLNQLVDASVLLVGAITDQPSITANTLEATDTTIVNDAGVLKEASIGDILNSNLPVTTSSINGVTGADIAVNPASGQKFDVNGALESTTNNTTGNSTVGGDLTITGATTANGLFTSNGVANFTGTFQVNGSTGYVLYEVSELALPTTVYAQGGTQTTTAFTTAAFATKPADEIWEFKSNFFYSCNGWPYKVGIRYSSQAILSGNYLGVETYQDANGSSTYIIRKFQQEWTVPAGTALAGTTLSIDIYTVSGQLSGTFLPTSGYDALGAGWVGNLPPPNILIYKYKTA